MDLVCKFCGAEIEAEERCRGTIAPCPGCTQKIAVPDLGQKQCPACRELVAATARKCEHCNTLLDEMPEVPPKRGFLGQFMRVFKRG